MTSVKRFRPGEDDVLASEGQQLSLRAGDLSVPASKGKPLNVLFFARLCESKGVPRPPAKEFVFHPTRKWALDIAWPDLKVALEVHGAVHHQGRHVRGSGFIEDRNKMNEAAILGWIVIEVGRSVGSEESWLSLETVDLIARAIARQKVRRSS